MRPDSTFPARKSRRARIFPVVSPLSASWSDTFVVRQSCPASVPYPAPLHKAGAALVRQCARRPAAPGQPNGHTSTTHASGCAPFTGGSGIIMCAVWRVQSGPYSQRPAPFDMRPNSACCFATAIHLPSQLRCWDGACPGSDASAFRRSRAARETIRRLDCWNGWPSCLPICRPPSIRRTGCGAISFTHLTRPGMHGAQSLPGCRKAAVTSSLHFFSPRVYSGWIFPTTGHPLLPASAPWSNRSRYSAATTPPSRHSPRHQPNESALSSRRQPQGDVPPSVKAFPTRRLQTKQCTLGITHRRRSGPCRGHSLVCPSAASSA